ncbi:MAG: OmpA family protein [Candidatus Adiutrix sp.]
MKKISMLLAVACMGALLVMGCGRTGQLTTEAVESETIHFDLGQYTLRPEAVQTLDHKIAYLKHWPGHVIFIVGHADFRNDDRFNLELAHHRSQEAKRYLVENGINPKRIFTMAKGKRLPIAQGTSDQATFENRRNEFYIVATGSLQ